MTENNYDDVEREAVDDQDAGGLEPSKVADLEDVFDTAWQDGRRPERQCTAHRTNGDPCRRAAINGGTVCATHGGRSPQVKAKARVRLEMAADRMAKELLKIAVSDDAPDNVKLAAIKDALDRAGLSPKTAVEVSVDPKPFEQLLSGMATLTGGSRAASRGERGVAEDQDADTAWITEELAASNVIDVEVEDPEPRPRPSEEPATPKPRDTGLMDMETALAQLRATTPPPAPTGKRRGRTG
ncbi:MULTISPECIES: hypothetical protein [Tsukamurella]|uniref:Uncharacterized protein n=3 Tax=Tsukamurella TaxID=2060 RepID=A0A3P8KZW3_TSUPA|nr:MULTISPECIES: hypothetical protein [Tsukamurella]NMD57595.1 hypothetical protein [Tsukamurella columbiensis]TWS28999.1 hypothetical protein FK530_09245 [Tsukamurella conjunctivitidis]UEA84792.1 hypothetical protein LK411_08230 [Tsukamurella paurometabola]VDR37375.1 Uncharacterised protein [Tsukamurella paurometabola]